MTDPGRIPTAEKGQGTNQTIVQMLRCGKPVQETAGWTLSASGVASEASRKTRQLRERTLKVPKALVCDSNLRDGKLEMKPSPQGELLSVPHSELVGPGQS